MTPERWMICELYRTPYDRAVHALAYAFSQYQGRVMTAKRRKL